MRIAIITGASSGLGAEYVSLIDAKNYVDEIWVIARRGKRLEELQEKCKTPVRPLCLDLTSSKSMEKLQNLLEETAKNPNVKNVNAEDSGDKNPNSPHKKQTQNDPTLQIALLINAAGFGKFGDTSTLSQSEINSMIALNCTALVEVTRICLPYMSRGSRILQFASSAAFQPLQGLSIYAASKSFVLSFTRSLRRECKGRGIYISAVCPIWVKTEFIKVARECKDGTSVKHPWPQISAKRVVKWSNFINKLNYPVICCSPFSFLMRLFGKIIPAPIMMWIWEGMRKI